MSPDLNRAPTQEIPERRAAHLIILVLVLLAVTGGTHADGWELAEEPALGAVVGVFIPYAVLLLEHRPFSARNNQPADAPCTGTAAGVIE